MSSQANHAWGWGRASPPAKTPGASLIEACRATACGVGGAGTVEGRPSRARNQADQLFLCWILRLPVPASPRTPRFLIVIGDSPSITMRSPKEGMPCALTLTPILVGAYLVRYPDSHLGQQVLARREFGQCAVRMATTLQWQIGIKMSRREEGSSARLRCSIRNLPIRCHVGAPSPSFLVPTQPSQGTKVAYASRHPYDPSQPSLTGIFPHAVFPFLVLSLVSDTCSAAVSCISLPTILPVFHLSSVADRPFSK